PRREGKGEPRGEGFELRTDQYGAIRAGQGMLISTDARHNESSTHLDSKELTNQLQGNLELSKTLSDAAKEHHADPLDANDEAERLIKVANKTYTQQGGTGQKSEVPGYDEPILAFSSPAGIVSATPKSYEIATGERIHLSSQRDTNIAVGNKLSMAVKEAWSVFVAKAGIKMFAGKGKVQIQAQDDEIEAIAKKDLKITSVDGHIEITAPKSIRLTAGGCQIEVGNGQITLKAPGPVNIHGSVKNLTGPARITPQLPELPSSEAMHTKKFALIGLDGMPIEGAEVNLFDPEKKEKIWSSPIAATGYSEPVPEKLGSAPYVAVIGLKGSVFHFYDTDENPREEEEDEIFEDEHPSREGE
ncbi:MAG TPA: type VI secretion system Vgr family protein, partial [Noviherbaspirillum sp.]|nr:type VI secretion system Vgr family protein [Noviherbaspirillum sp.]